MAEDDWNFSSPPAEPVTQERPTLGPTYEPAAWDLLEKAIIRSILSVGILTILGGTIGAIFALMYTGRFTASDQKDLAITVLTAVVGIAGTVLGFYFASHGDSARPTSIARRRRSTK